MKKVLLIPFLLSFNLAYAGTGSANDVIEFYLSIIAILLFIVAVLYTITFIRRIIKERKEKKITPPEDNVDGENIG